MILFIPKLFDEMRCAELTKIAVDYHARNSLSFEGKDFHYGNSFGTARIPEYEKVLQELTPIIKMKTGYHHMVIENSYTRIYLNGADLKKHTDRVGLDVTLSVCTYNDIGKPWPLYVTDLNGVTQAIETAPGDGALILGTRYPHWRDKLDIADHQKVVQSFYHWKF